MVNLCLEITDTLMNGNHLKQNKTKKYVIMKLKEMFSVLQMQS